MLVLCTAVYVFFALIDIIPIVRAKRWKTLVLYAVLIITAYVLTVLTESGVKVPSPAEPLKRMVTAIVGRQEG